MKWWDAGKLVERGHLGLACSGQAVVLPRWSRLGLPPLVLHEVFAPEFAQQGVQRAFLGGELGVRQPTKDVRHIETLAAHDLEDDEFEESLAKGGEFDFGWRIHLFRYLYLTRYL